MKQRSRTGEKADEGRLSSAIFTEQNDNLRVREVTLLHVEFKPALK